jgi:lysophospholipase L1-like esterase
MKPPQLVTIMLVTLMTLTVLNTVGVVTATPTAPQKIVCIGDSITEPWPAMLQQRLGSGWTVIGKGVGGDSTAGMLSRFNADVIANHPQFVVICAGTAALGQGEGTEQIESNIAQMCDLAVANGIRPVLCTIPPREDHNGAYIQCVNDINLWVKGYAARNEWDVIDFYALLNDPANPGHYRTQYSSGDGVHPNYQGYQAMSEYVPLKIFGLSLLGVSSSSGVTSRYHSCTIGGSSLCTGCVIASRSAQRLLTTYNEAISD